MWSHVFTSSIPFVCSYFWAGARIRDDREQRMPKKCLVISAVKCWDVEIEVVPSRWGSPFYFSLRLFLLEKWRQKSCDKLRMWLGWADKKCMKAFGPTTAERSWEVNNKMGLNCVVFKTWIGFSRHRNLHSDGLRLGRCWGPEQRLLPNITEKRIVVSRILCIWTVKRLFFYILCCRLAFSRAPWSRRKRCRNLKIRQSLFAVVPTI